MKCCICLSKINNNSKITVCKQCNNYNHEVCFNKWYCSYSNKKYKCPYCKYTTSFKPMVITYTIDLENNDSIDYDSSSSSIDEENEIQELNIVNENTIGITRENRCYSFYKKYCILISFGFLFILGIFFILKRFSYMTEHRGNGTITEYNHHHHHHFPRINIVMN